MTTVSYCSYTSLSMLMSASTAIQIKSKIPENYLASSYKAIPVCPPD